MPNPKMELVVPRFVNVTRSFSQKVNPANYGLEGRNYESVDFFASFTDQIPSEGCTDEQMYNLSESLYRMAKKTVEESIKTYLDEQRGVVPISLTQKEIDQIAPIVKMIAEGKDVRGTVLEIKKDLNENQLNFLRAMVKDALKKNE